MKSKPILITGAGGFIGSHLAEALASHGHKVRAFFHYNSRNHFGWLDDSPLRSRMDVVTGDIRDFDSIQSAMKGCDEVFHLAALIGIPYSYVSPLAYVKTNIEGTYNVLESARRLGLKNVIVTSTSETYGSAQYTPIDEKHSLVGQSPYSATKIAADQLALSYHTSFGVPVKVARPFNTYGPRQSARAIIPSIVIQLLSGSKKLKLGNLHTTRDLNFVGDTVRGILSIADCPKLTGEATNIGSNQEISIKELADRIMSIMKVRAPFSRDPFRVRPKNSEVERLRADITKIQSFTGWRPKTSLDQGLKITIDWIKKNKSHFKSDLYNV